MSLVHRCMIVPIAEASAARAICEGLFGDAGANMFVSPLSPSGGMPATHYFSSGLIDESAAMMLDDPSLIPSEYRDQAMAILTKVIVSNKPLEAAFADNGLQQIG